MTVPKVSSPIFNIAFTQDGEKPPRLYYLLGGKDLDVASHTKFYEELRTRQDDDNGTSLEPLDVDKNDYRKDLGLAADYQGRVVFVQKHRPDDEDYDKGTHPGYNTLETFNLVERIYKKIFNTVLPIADDAIPKMQKFVDSVRKIDAFNKDAGLASVSEDMPVYEGCEDVLAKLKKLKPAAKPERAFLVAKRLKPAAEPAAPAPGADAAKPAVAPEAAKPEAPQEAAKPKRPLSKLVTKFSKPTEKPDQAAAPVPAPAPAPLTDRNVAVLRIPEPEVVTDAKPAVPDTAVDPKGHAEPAVPPTPVAEGKPATPKADTKPAAAPAPAPDVAAKSATPKVDPKPAAAPAPDVSAKPATPKPAVAAAPAMAAKPATPKPAGKPVVEPEKGGRRERIAIGEGEEAQGVNKPPVPALNKAPAPVVNKAPAPAVTEKPIKAEPVKAGLDKEKAVPAATKAAKAASVIQGHKTVVSQISNKPLINIAYSSNPVTGIPQLDFLIGSRNFDVNEHAEIWNDLTAPEDAADPSDKKEGLVVRQITEEDYALYSLPREFKGRIVIVKKLSQEDTDYSKLKEGYSTLETYERMAKILGSKLAVDPNAPENMRKYLKDLEGVAMKYLEMGTDFYTENPTFDGGEKVLQNLESELKPKPIAPKPQTPALTPLKQKQVAAEPARKPATPAKPVQPAKPVNQAQVPNKPKVEEARKPNVNPKNQVPAKGANLKEYDIQKIALCALGATITGIFAYAVSQLGLAGTYALIELNFYRTITVLGNNLPVVAGVAAGLGLYALYNMYSNSGKKKVA